MIPTDISGSGVPVHGIELSRAMAARLRGVRDGGQAFVLTLPVMRLLGRPQRRASDAS